ncbi:hypothetical protein FHS18_005342 [Paenibacillus phyllosphaerae]|uniref:Uncharacterized protein n=1 Tax=Paenibacillus phyllosphaerae TaxID=274593 RepID=A0A7W5B2H2_9BACL|nr:hypothetical protein [Paenibacillus phyllosphaerae]MBB3113239.1 hypothetical protein [Paenibacillus phyllosphaerae]
MRYMVQYLPLHKLKSAMTDKATKRSKELRKVAQDCMQLMIVRKSRKDGGYVVVNGSNHLEHYRRFSNKKTVPCLVDEGKIASTMTALWHQLRKRKLPHELPSADMDQTSGNGWSIIRSFLKQDPRFKTLSRREQAKVLRLGIQYKKTTIRSMKSKVDELIKRQAAAKK